MRPAPPCGPPCRVIFVVDVGACDGRGRRAVAATRPRPRAACHCVAVSPSRTNGSCAGCVGTAPWPTRRRRASWPSTRDGAAARTRRSCGAPAAMLAGTPATAAHRRLRSDAADRRSGARVVGGLDPARIRDIAVAEGMHTLTQHARASWSRHRPRRSTKSAAPSRTVGVSRRQLDVRGASIASSVVIMRQ